MTEPDSSVLSGSARRIIDSALMARSYVDIGRPNAFSDAITGAYFEAEVGAEFSKLLAEEVTTAAAAAHERYPAEPIRVLTAVIEAACKRASIFLTNELSTASFMVLQLATMVANLHDAEPQTVLDGLLMFIEDRASDGAEGLTNG